MTHTGQQVEVVLYGMTDEAFSYLDACARIRHISRRRLMRNVLRAVCTDQLVLAVLDDDSLPEEKQKRARLVKRRSAYAGQEDGTSDDDDQESDPA